MERFLKSTKGGFTLSNSIVEHWNNTDRKLPYFDVIVYPNGNVTILNFYSCFNPNSGERLQFCSPVCDTTIDSIVKYNGDCWTPVDEWIGTRIGYKNRTIFGGEGAMGSDGFIACVDEEENLIWAMFFSNTNPIKNIEIVNNTLLATNEHSDLQLEINLDSLTDIKIKNDELKRIPIK